MRTHSLRPGSVLIAEDHPIYREGLISNLSARWPGVKIFEANDGIETVKLLSQESFDLVFLDYYIPYLKGDQCLMLMREMNLPTPPKVLALSFDDSPSLIRRMISQGANGYLLKDSDREIFDAAILAVLNGKTWFPPSFNQNWLNTLPDQTSLKEDVSGLTDTQKKLLFLLSIGMGYDQIANTMQLRKTTIYKYCDRLPSLVKGKDAQTLLNYQLVNGILSFEDFTLNKHLFKYL